MHNKGLCGFSFRLSYCILHIAAYCSSLKNKNTNRRPCECFILGRPSVGECEQEALVERGDSERELHCHTISLSLGKDGAGSWNPGRPAAVPAWTWRGQLHSQLSFGVNHTAGDAGNRLTWGNLIPGSLLIFTAGPLPRSDN